MKLLKKTISLVISLSVLLCIFTGCASEEPDAKFEMTNWGDKVARNTTLGYATEEELLSKMESISVKYGYELLLDRTTLTVAVKDSRTGKVYFSNPYDAATDAFCTGAIKKALESQLEINYSDASGKTKTLYSSSDCVALGQYELEKTENGVIIKYSIGEEKDMQLVPQRMGKADFEAILEKLADEKNAVSRLKALYKAETLESGEEVYTARALSPRERKQVDGYMRIAGYTQEQLEQDAQKYAMERETVDFPNFKLCVVYELTEDGFTASIPADEIIYDKSKYTLLDVTLLKYFSAVDASVDEENDGYLFLPDGCGTIVDFNDPTENRQVMISGDVYGPDLAQVTSTKYTGQQFCQPVFGLKNHDYGYFAIITEGSALSRISGYAGSQIGEYFAACPTFLYVKREAEIVSQRAIGNEMTIYYVDENYYTGNYTVKYVLLDEEDASYVGMADIYRDYLIEQGMNDQAGESNLFLSVETVGTLAYDTNFLGVHYTAEAPLTTFKQNIDLLQFFRNNGVDNLSLTLSGWRTNGYETPAVSAIDPSNALGGQKEFDALMKWCSENNVPVYPDLNMSFVYEDGCFDDFSPKADAVYLLNEKYAGRGHYTVAPTSYSKFLGKFMNSCQESGVTAFGVRNLGYYLTANYKKDNATNREQSLQLVKDLLAGASEEYGVMVSMGNGYTLPYTSFVEILPTDDSGYRGTNAVPFIQLVLSGYVRYGSYEINLLSDPDMAILRCIESRTAPHYVMVADNAMKIKQTGFTDLYSVDSEYLGKDAVAAYQRYKDALGATEGARMIDHEILADGVSKVTYSNGVEVYVNYNDTEYRSGDIVVQPGNYLTIGG